MEISGRDTLDSGPARGIDGLAKLRLDGRIALITGAGSGIGRETAYLLAQRGAFVVVSDIRGERAEETAEAIRGEGGNVLALEVDVGFSDQVERMIVQTVAHFGGLHILCNNAAFQVFGSVEEVDEAGWDRTQDVTLKSVYFGCKFALPHIRAAGGGAIVNVASMHAITGFRGAAAYQAAKGGVCALTRQLAVQYGRENIRANAVLPGPTLTGIFKDLDVPQSYVDICARRMPILRVGQPSETAEAIAFLVSDAASLITGVSLPVDGGATIVGEPEWLSDEPEVFRSSESPSL